MTADAAGGVGVFADELARALVARGHQVLVVVFSPTQPAFSPGLPRLWAPFRLEWMDCDGSSTPVAADAFQARAFLVDIARHWRPDVLHSNHFAYAGALARVPTVLTVHSDVISWWRTVRGSAPPDNAYQRWYAALAQQAIACSPCLVAPSRSARRDLKVSFPVRRAVQVIYNGHDPALFPQRPKQRFALAAGRLWDDGKQLSLLGKLPRALPIEIVLAGEQRHPLSPAPTTPPAGPRTLGALPSEALREVMARARVYIGTSLYEPFGLAALEAALSGCALFLNDIPSWRELWAPVGCFYSNLVELRALLERAAEDAGWAQERGAAARRHASRRYTAARLGEAYESAYRGV
ncbi:MAG: glycosyltransferase family 4 protein, partial [Terriglobales bacterium]